MYKPLSRSASIFASIIALFAWFGLGLQLFLLLDNTPANGMTPLQAVARFLLFFTILTNLIVATGITSRLIAPAHFIGRYFSRPSVATAVTVYILMVGITYNVVLRGLYKLEGLNRVADEILHVVVPVLYTVFWILFVRKGKLKWKHPIPWLIYPGLYLIYALLRGKLEGFYPYPFINVNELGMQRVLLHSAGIMVLFLGISYLLVFVDRRMSK